MSDELARLKKEKKELERRIQMLECGSIFKDFVKLDIIHTPGKQQGHWAVSYKYFHIVRRGRQGILEEREKWVPLFNCENRERAIEMIPKAISQLTELYEEATNGADS